MGLVHHACGQNVHCRLQIHVVASLWPGARTFWQWGHHPLVSLKNMIDLLDCGLGDGVSGLVGLVAGTASVPRK